MFETSNYLSFRVNHGRPAIYLPPEIFRATTTIHFGIFDIIVFKGEPYLFRKWVDSRHQDKDCLPGRRLDASTLTKQEGKRL